MTPHGVLADRFFAAIEAGDIDAIRTLYHPDAVIWHNTDSVEQSPQENLRVLKWLIRNFSARRYDVRKRIVNDDGFVQQHVLHLGNENGALAIHACVIVTIEHGCIVRLDEYIDSKQIGGLGGLITG
ncbi:MAG TPA: ketosteroid isomerase [Alphaproteobacteria bacterium]|nr:ketosteroid isomerase [Alphaproteobacteria bacterium]